MTTTRERLVEAARQLIAEQGYGPTTVAQVVKRAEAHPGSLYHAFPTKQDLLVAVLENYLTRLRPQIVDPAWRSVEDPIARVFALLGLYRKLLVQSGRMFGCPIGSIALELHDPDPPVRALLAKNFDRWIGAVEECFVAAKDRLPADADPKRLATFVLTTMEGGVMLARTYRSLEAFDAAVESLRDYIARLMTPRTGGTR